jgi:outer membrane protein TolC
VPSAALGALGSAFSGLPFGNENTWVAGLSFSQPVFAGGRIRSSIDMADYGRDAAEAAYDDASADVALQVKQAYFDAAMAQSSVDIVEASVSLASDHLERVKLQLDAGRASELEALRAEVELENLKPQLVQAQNRRALAMMNLKRLVNLPAQAELIFTTPLVPSDSSSAPAFAAELPSLDRADAALSGRASLRSAEATVSMREEQVDIAKAAFLPSLSLTGNLTRQAFPTGTFGVPSGGDWRDDWNVGFAVQWPLFQGLRRNADLDAARAQVRQAELQRDQLREGVRLEYEQARGELERARAQIGASRRTVDQAARVYDLTEMRFTEGLATQLDVSDARLSLQQARLNEVQAWHDAQLALARVERALGAGTGARGIR